MRPWSFIVPRFRRRVPSDGGDGGIEHACLDSSNDAGLAKALVRLSPGSRAWIGFENYMHLFATDETYLPPSEWDPDDHRKVSEFAMAYDCSIRVVDLERRIYFLKKPHPGGSGLRELPRRFSSIARIPSDRARRVL